MIISSEILPHVYDIDAFHTTYTFWKKKYSSFISVHQEIDRKPCSSLQLPLDCKYNWHVSNQPYQWIITQCESAKSYFWYRSVIYIIHFTLLYLVMNESPFGK